MVRIFLYFVFCILLFSVPVPAQDCIDYEDYLHVLSSTEIPKDFGDHISVSVIVARSDTLLIAVRDKGILSAAIGPDNSLSILSITPTWGGYPRSLVQSGSQLLVADGTAGLQVYDVSDASSPQWLAHIDTPGYALDVEACGDRALVLDDFLGLVVIDIHEVRAPHIVTSLSLPGTPGMMEKNGDLLFVACGYSGLAVVDISLPDMPRLVEVREFSAPVEMMKTGGNTLVIAHDTSEERAIGFYKIDEQAQSLILESELPMEWPNAWNMLIHGDLLFVSGYGSGVHVINFSATDAPFVQAYFYYSTMTKYSALAVVGDTLISAWQSIELVDINPLNNAPQYGAFPLDGSVEKVAVYDQLVYTAGTSPRLQVADISDPNDPVVTVPMPSGSSSSIAVHDGFLYLGDSAHNVEIFSLEDPLHPEIVNQLDDTQDILHISFYDNLMVLVRNDSFLLYDASYPEDPQLLSETSTVTAFHADVQGNYLYLACKYQGGLRVYDISNTRTPFLTHTLNTDMIAPISVDAEGDYLYTSNVRYQEGFHVFDISTPEVPELIATPFHDETQVPCFVRDGYAYMCSSEGPVKVIDISNPYDPQIVGSFGNHSHYCDIVAAGNHLFLLGADHGMEIGFLQCPTISAVYSSPELVQVWELKIYPNPFNPRTNIEWTNAQPGNVQVAVYDLAGRRVAVLADKFMHAGVQTLQWDGVSDTGVALPSGVYLVSAYGSGFVFNQRINLVR